MKLQKFLDKLPILETIPPVKRDKKGSYYEVTMREFTQKLHRDLKPTRLWGYNGMYPGPTFDVMKNETTYVKWINDLPTKHFLPIDTTIHGADRNLPEVRTVVHVHGGKQPAHSDGYPEAWFTRNFEQTGPLFEREVYEYPNLEAAPLWYHDHSMGITRLNMYAGLAGFYIIRDKYEQSLNLPRGVYEIPLLVQDRSFNPDGSLYYPSTPDKKNPRLPFPSIVTPFDADTILVNGKVWPYLEVEPRKYRFRILNSSNSRAITFKLDSGQPLFQIGTDRGLLERPVKMNEILLLTTERADVIVDFSRSFGKSIVLKNVFKGASPETTDVMQFRVTVPLKGKDTSSLPEYLTKIDFLSRKQASKTRDLTLVRVADEYGRSLNLLDGKMWIDRISEKIELGTVEIWRLINVSADDHPIHLHIVDMQILERQPFNVAHFQTTGKLKFTGPKDPPEPNERGFKDTIRAPAGQVTSFIASFGPLTGRFVWHCHMLEHEDYEMMRPFEILKKKNKLKDIITRIIYPSRFQ
ncbi:multicopper oxidase domain-containing protein [Paenibacillus sp. LMG 31456]|uniref:Multicopper oxidase domain-containing protein n=1 Tax=Paenibacillus foliorum TaxID=2654974 RepID=A0A972JZB4_9BACL|nr:multicopper oxidase domain-containing protein [Paenibacillus foliorum]